MQHMAEWALREQRGPEGPVEMEGSVVAAVVAAAATALAGARLAACGGEGGTR